MKKKILIVSPHLDDAVLSCGDFISKISNKVIVDVLTVFSNEYNNNDFSKGIINYHSKCFLPYKSMYHRKSEDLKALKILNCNPIYMDLDECLYRKNNGRFIYPNDKKIYKLSKKDKQYNEKVLKEKFNFKIYDYIFFPLAIGKHVDHQIINEFGYNLEYTNIYFYEDVPYICYNKGKYPINFKKKYNLHKSININEENFQKKILAILEYKSQHHILWPDYLKMLSDLNKHSMKKNQREFRIWVKK